MHVSQNIKKLYEIFVMSLKKHFVHIVADSVKIENRKKQERKILMYLNFCTAD